MDTKQKMVIAGSGLVVGHGVEYCGCGANCTGGVRLDRRLAEKAADGVAAKLEGASKTVGIVAGTLQRSFNEAKSADVAEMRRYRSSAL